MDTGLNTVLGKAVDPETNPFSEEYQGGSYFEIPDVYEPEMQTNIGKFARGLVEFGFLTRWTGGVGGFGLAKTGLTKTPMARSVGAYIAGNKKLQFLEKIFKISSRFLFTLFSLPNTVLPVPLNSVTPLLVEIAPILVTIA